MHVHVFSVIHSQQYNGLSVSDTYLLQHDMTQQISTARSYCHLVSSGHCHLFALNVVTCQKDHFC